MRRDVPQFPIAAVLEELGFEDVPVVSSGYAKVRCAFHGDRTPSASVGRYSFCCFACGRKGDALKLLMEEENIGFSAAIERATELTGTATTETRSKASPWDALSLG